MKIVAALLRRLSRKRDGKPDTFEHRLENMGAEAQKTRHAEQPALFVRARRQAA